MSIKLLIHGRNLELTSSLKEYTENKLIKAIKHFEEIVQEVDVHLSIAKNPRVSIQTAEVTLFINGTVIRAEERSENLYSSIDLVANKLSRQLRKFKERHTDHYHSDGHSASKTIDTDAVCEDLPIKESLIEGKEVTIPDPGFKNKYFEMKPISASEAKKQLDIIDHDFYLFKEKETNRMKVIYKRNHGGYGIIQSKN
tara:strand:+ start:1673 stop:2266 length:594 start_codon:yes stop_codon:yes gene_type:complete